MNFISINELMSRLTRHPLLQDLNLETVIEYTVDFMRIIGMPRQFLEKTEVIDVKQHRAKLPCDFYEMIQVRDVGPCGKPNKAWRYSTDNFHMNLDKHKWTDPTYKIQGNWIFTSPMECGQIEIAYLAFQLDEDGYPMLPDSSAFIRALEAFIKFQWFTIQFDMGKITQQVMQKADQDYCWAVGQCRTDMIRPSLDQMQSIANMLNNFVVKAGNHKYGFVRQGTKEHLINH